MIQSHQHGYLGDATVSTRVTSRLHTSTHSVTKKSLPLLLENFISIPSSHLRFVQCLGDSFSGRPLHCRYQNKRVGVGDTKKCCLFLSAPTTALSKGARVTRRQQFPVSNLRLFFRGLCKHYGHEFERRVLGTEMNWKGGYHYIHTALSATIIYIMYMCFAFGMGVRMQMYIARIQTPYTYMRVSCVICGNSF